MMSQYHQQLIEEADDGEDDGTEMEMSRAQIVYAQMHARGNKWPRVIGIVEIVAGMILVLLGTLEVFIVPMIESKDGSKLIVVDKRNCYGVGLIAGIVMVITGNTALRATMSKRTTTMNRFFNLTILSILVYTGLTVFLIVAYSLGWTAADKYPEGSRMREVHVFVTIFTVLGLMFALSAMFQYCDVICCGRHGQDPLWQLWARCLCACCYGRVRQSWHGLTSDLYQDEVTRRNDPI